MYFDLDQWQWGSRLNYADGTLKPWKLDKIVIHWGGYTDPGDSQDHEAAVLRGWQRYHIDSRGWTDIAYSYGIGNTGLVYRLRGMNRNGATSGDIDGDGIPEGYEALALVWIGGLGHGPPTDAAFAAMGRAVRDVFDEYGVVRVTGHMDHKATACPGPDWMAWIARKGWEDDSVPIVTPPIEGDHQMRTIRRGDGYLAVDERNKPTVKMGQQGLAHQGFADQKSEDETCASDGIFGPGTEEAVKDFQQAAGLVIDGVVGPETWEALEL